MPKRREKTNEELIQGRIDKALKVGELVEALQSMDQDMPVGVVGHFGEALMMDKHDFLIRKAYVTPDWLGTKEDRRYIDILELECPGRGEDPD